MAEEASITDAYNSVRPLFSYLSLSDNILVQAASRYLYAGGSDALNLRVKQLNTR